MISVEIISYLIELKQKLFKALRWPIDQIEKFIDKLIMRIATFAVTILN